MGGVSSQRGGARRPAGRVASANAASNTAAPRDELPEQVGRRAWPDDPRTGADKSLDAPSTRAAIERMKACRRRELAGVGPERDAAAFKGGIHAEHDGTARLGRM